MADIAKVAEELVNLTVKEVNELAELLKTEYGIEPAAAAVAVAAAPSGGGGDAGGGAEAKDEWDIVLKSAGASKLGVVKEVKTLLNVGLKEAKDMVDGAPATIKEGVPTAEANSIKEKLEAAGAEVELK